MLLLITLPVHQHSEISSVPSDVKTVLIRNESGFRSAESQIEFALHHLDQIPASAVEYADAAKLRSLIQAFNAKVEADHQKAEEAHAAFLIRQQALLHQSEDESRDQMFKNFTGQAHDPYECSISTNDNTIISFDYGHHWWLADDRCDAEIQKQRAEKEAREAADRQRKEQEQRARDSDAEMSSYWPTTVRVSTDMDSFWLNNEERNCQTYPDENGRVSTVSCNTSGSHKDHNIPVKFWGGVDRNKVSDWKCRRESDDFVCRALN